jgi:hypothetical protein
MIFLIIPMVAQTVPERDTLAYDHVQWEKKKSCCAVIGVEDRQLQYQVDFPVFPAQSVAWLNDSISKKAFDHSFHKDFSRLYTVFYEMLEKDAEEGLSISASWEKSVQVTVEYNSKKILGIGTHTFLFSGGAHGNYDTQYTNYVLSEKKPLTLKDLIDPSTKAALQKLLASRIRELFEMENEVPLSGFLLVNEIPLTENFLLTKNAIIFSYPPYEIADYSKGQIEVEVELSQMTSFLSPKGKQLLGF